MRPEEWVVHEYEAYAHILSLRLIKKIEQNTIRFQNRICKAK